jgi:hypothetical protein
VLKRCASIPACNINGQSKKSLHQAKPADVALNVVGIMFLYLVASSRVRIKCHENEA